MKNITHNTRSAVWLLVLLAVATLSGCQKDEPLPPGGNIPAAKSSTRSIPHYNDERTFLRTLNTILAFDSLPQRLTFEAANGRSSAGCRADVLCATIEPATLPDEPAALDFYNHHTALLDTLHLSGGSTAIVPRWYNNPPPIPCRLQRSLLCRQHRLPPLQVRRSVLRHQPCTVSCRP